MPNGTISLTQPDLVGAVRGFDAKNITVCFEPLRVSEGGSGGGSEGGVVQIVSAVCVPRVNPLVQVFVNLNQNQGLIQGVSGTGRVIKKEKIESENRSRQIFDFMKDNGEKYKIYGQRS